MKPALCTVLALSLAACGSNTRQLQGTGGTGGTGGGTGGASSGGTSGSGGSATGGAAGSGGSATGGAAGSGGSATGGAAGSGGSATGGAAGSGGSATGGTGGTGAGGTGGNATAAAADEIGVLFYKKSDGSNSLRWIKADYTQRTATSFGLSNSWASITAVSKLAGAGGELIFHGPTGSPSYPGVSVLVNNDATSSQKTATTLGASYDLATKRSDGKVMLLNGSTGAWLTGGWGSANWTKDYDGTLTLPASTTFEHFHRCGTAVYIFYSTNDTLLYTRIFGTGFTAATQLAVPASSHAVCLGANENFTFVFNASTGSAKLFSASTELKSWPASSFGAWTHFVNLRNGKTLFYRASTGEGAIGEFTSGAPYFTQLGGFVANTFPKDMDIVSAL